MRALLLIFLLALGSYAAEKSATGKRPSAKRKGALTQPAGKAGQRAAVKPTAAQPGVAASTAAAVAPAVVVDAAAFDPFRPAPGTPDVTATPTPAPAAPLKAAGPTVLKLPPDTRALDAGSAALLPGLEVEPPYAQMVIGSTEPVVLKFRGIQKLEDTLVCYQVLSHPTSERAVRESADCSDPQAFSAFKGNGSWSYRDGVWIGRLAYSADPWGAPGIRVRYAFRDAGTGRAGGTVLDTVLRPKP